MDAISGMLLVAAILLLEWMILAWSDRMARDDGWRRPLPRWTVPKAENIIVKSRRMRWLMLKRQNRDARNPELRRRQYDAYQRNRQSDTRD